MAKIWTAAQQDWFEEAEEASAPLAPAERAKGVEQLQALLIEAVPADQRGRGDDQDPASHLALAAVVYVRQSTAYYVTFNLESQRRQYASPTEPINSDGPMSK